MTDEEPTAGRRPRWVCAAWMLAGLVAILVGAFNVVTGNRVETSIGTLSVVVGAGGLRAGVRAWPSTGGGAR